MTSFYNQASIASVAQFHGDLGDMSVPFGTLASGTPYAYPVLFNPHQDQDYQLRNMLNQQQESNHQLVISGLNDCKASQPTDNYTCDHEDHMGSNLKLSLCTQGETVDDQQPNIKWMSSKMRIMRKMMNSGHKLAVRQTRKSLQFTQEQTLAGENMVPNQDSGNSPNAGVIRVCSDCNTTKTPLWRSGPRGPKSLCNACGIRQRKARRAMAAAAAAANGGQIVQTKLACPAKLSQENNMLGDQALPFKKRGRTNVNSNTNTHENKKKLCLKEFKRNLSNKPAFHQVFPQDERDAAFLLMDLSCGLIKS